MLNSKVSVFTCREMLIRQQDDRICFEDSLFVLPLYILTNLPDTWKFDLFSVMHFILQSYIFWQKHTEYAQAIFVFFDLTLAVS